jgi:exoribonuclease R
MQEDLVKVTPAVELQVVFDPNGGRAFQVRLAPLPLDVATGELNESLDRLLTAVDRQMARYELLDSMARLKEQVSRIEKYEGMVVTLEEQAKIDWENSGRRGNWSVDNLPPSYKNARETTKINLQKERAEADALQDKVHRLHSMVNGHADSRANSQSG